MAYLGGKINELKTSIIWSRNKKRASEKIQAGTARKGSDKERYKECKLTLEGSAKERVQWGTRRR